MEHRPLVSLSLALVIAVVPMAVAQTPRPGDPLEAARRAISAGDPARAVELLDGMLRHDPNHASALLERSTARCMLGELDGCKDDLEKALRADPKLRQAWLNRSAIAIAEERWDDAMRDLQEAERLDPTATDNAVNQGAVELLRGDLPAATVLFRRHLERFPDSSDAWYLVASNYAHAGYAALAVQHLDRAIALDERSRVRARADANFADLASHRSFQQLLTTDAWVAPVGALAAERVFRSRYTTADSPIVVAVLNTLQLSGARLDPRVELTADWALFWSDFRIKLVRNDDDTTTIELTAPPGLYSPSSWEARTATFFSDIETQLLRLELSAERRPRSP